MENTREAVKNLRSEHLDWTLAQIAKEVGVTRQRVSQLLHTLYLPARGFRAKPIKICRVCNQITPNKQLVCPEHREQLYYKTVECDFCHKSKKVRKAVYIRALLTNQKRFFCSRPCYYSGRKLMRYASKD